MKIKPKIKAGSIDELREYIENMKYIYRSCLNCEYFNEEKEICKQYNQRPPARIIAYACKDWADIEIPF